ncbi:MAG: hypothetical protein AAF495_21135 [Pseudomonadota bacterium]
MTQKLFLLKQRNVAKSAKRGPNVTDHVYDQISPNLLPLLTARYV